MKENKELKKCQEITINIPFTYTIGDRGFHSGKVLKTIQDCKDEVLLEIKSGLYGEVLMKLENLG